MEKQTIPTQQDYPLAPEKCFKEVTSGGVMTYVEFCGTKDIAYITNQTIEFFAEAIIKRLRSN